jgi:hypothetical protein
LRVYGSDSPRVRERFSSPLVSFVYREQSARAFEQDIRGRIHNDLGDYIFEQVAEAGAALMRDVYVPSAVAFAPSAYRAAATAAMADAGFSGLSGGTTAGVRNLARLSLLSSFGAERQQVETIIHQSLDEYSTEVCQKLFEVTASTAAQLQVHAAARPHLTVPYIF